jgi:hypothetical protein
MSLADIRHKALLLDDIPRAGTRAKLSICHALVTVVTMTSSIVVVLRVPSMETSAPRQDSIYKFYLLFSSCYGI